MMLQVSMSTCTNDFDLSLLSYDFDIKVHEATFMVILILCFFEQPWYMLSLYITSSVNIRLNISFCILQENRFGATWG